MQKIIEASVLFRWLTAFFGWISVKWHQSRIVTWFLRLSGSQDIYDNSIYGKTGRSLHKSLCFVFEKLHLDKLFKGSIFKQVFFWCLIPAALAPLLPTMAVLCLVIVGIFSIAVRFGSDSEQKLFYSPVNKYIVLFAVIYLIATLTSVSVSGSIFNGLLTIVFALFAVVLTNAVTSKRQVDLMIGLFVLVGTAVSLYGIYQYFFYDPASAGAWIDNDMFSDITNRVYSTLGNPNVLAEYLLLITPFAAACMLTAKTGLRKLLFLLCLGAMLLCMLFTSSRGGWLGLIIAAAIFLIMLDARFLLLGIVALVLLYFTMPPWVIQRFTSIGSMSDSSTSYRVYIWMGTIAMLKEYWLSGIGPGTAAFNLIYPAYSYNTIAAPHAHNLFLQLVCDAGIMGLVIFLLLLFSFFRTTLSAFSQCARKGSDRTTRIYLAAAVSAVVGFMAQSMTDYSFYNNCVALFFWVVIALGSILARRQKMEEGYRLWSKY
jgi:putative inorganic carbon (hco3(-)) transporter